MKGNVVKVVAAIAGIVILDSVALMNGINGTLLLIAVVAIAGLGGYELRGIAEMLKGKKPPLLPVAYDAEKHSACYPMM